MKKEFLSKEGLEIYTEEFKAYIQAQGLTAEEVLDMILAGDNITITKDDATNKITVSLSQETKNAISDLQTDLSTLSEDVNKKALQSDLIIVANRVTTTQDNINIVANKVTPLQESVVALENGEIISSTEPTIQNIGDFWLQEY